MDNNFERWVKGYEGRYSVTIEGEVISYVRKSPKILKKAQTYRQGNKEDKLYYMVCLTSRSDDSKYKQSQFYVHRLVAEAFIPKLSESLIVNHKDGCKTNNHVSNLEWVTITDNRRHAYENGLHKRGVRNLTIAMVESGITSRLLYYSQRKFITETMMEVAGLPFELLKVTCFKGEYLYTWNYYLDLFTLCDSDLSLSSVAKLTNMDQSAISLIRNGKRLAKARVLYDKYKNQSKYFTNYTPVFKYPNDLKLPQMLAFGYKTLDS